VNHLLGTNPPGDLRPVISQRACSHEQAYMAARYGFLDDTVLCGADIFRGIEDLLRCRDVIVCARQQIGGASDIVQIELPAEPPACRVRLDARRLSRVFYNLCSNAMDFMPNGGKIFLRFQADENEIVTEIEDTGPGIAPEVADRLFQNFVTFGKSHGTGLGLSICKKIVEDHGGRIWVRNEPGHGAIFCFALPLAK